MGEWQPIETAPKDGSRFLFFNGEWMACGHYHLGQYFAADSGNGRRLLDPTHWMPLPPAPI